MTLEITNKKNAQYCTDIATNAKAEAVDTFGCNIIGVVTDDEKKLEMRESMKVSDSGLTVYGCSSLWLNLLGQEITPPQVISQVVEANKYFRNHHVPGALLSEISGSVNPQLPVDTRWKSQLECIDTCLRNIPYMMIVAENEYIIDSRIRNIIHNMGLCSEAKLLHKQLYPIAKALCKLQSDSSSIADACEIWLDFIKAKEFEPYKDIFDKRFKQAMTPSHVLANILHPMYKDKSLTTGQISIAH